MRSWLVALCQLLIFFELAATETSNSDAPTAHAPRCFMHELHSSCSQCMSAELLCCLFAFDCEELIRFRELRRRKHVESLAHAREHALSLAVRAFTGRVPGRRQGCLRFVFETAKWFPQVRALFPPADLSPAARCPPRPKGSSQQAAAACGKVHANQEVAIRRHATLCKRRPRKQSEWTENLIAPSKALVTGHRNGDAFCARRSSLALFFAAEWLSAWVVLSAT